MGATDTHECTSCMHRCSTLPSSGSTLTRTTPPSPSPDSHLPPSPSTPTHTCTRALNTSPSRTAAAKCSRSACRGEEQYIRFGSHVCALMGIFELCVTALTAFTQAATPPPCHRHYFHPLKRRPDTSTSAHSNGPFVDLLPIGSAEHSRQVFREVAAQAGPPHRAGVTPESDLPTHPALPPLRQAQKPQNGAGPIRLTGSAANSRSRKLEFCSVLLERLRREAVRGSWPGPVTGWMAPGCWGASASERVCLSRSVSLLNRPWQPEESKV